MMMRRWLVACSLTLPLALTGCSESDAGTGSDSDSGDGDGDGDGSGDGDGDGDGAGDGDGDGDGAGDGDGDGDGTGDGDGDGDGDGAPDDCELCWGEQCNQEIADCFADEVCNCWLNCDDDDPEACAAVCGEANGAVNDLWTCLNISTVTECADVCLDECEQCVTGHCQDALVACFEDPVCMCLLNCEGNEWCEDACGSSDDFEAVYTCYGEQQVGSCAEVCA